jgi:hypothetical protein
MGQPAVPSLAELLKDDRFVVPESAAYGVQVFAPR